MGGELWAVERVGVGVGVIGWVAVVLVVVVVTVVTVVLEVEWCWRVKKMQCKCLSTWNCHLRCTRSHVPLPKQPTQSWVVCWFV